MGDVDQFFDVFFYPLPPLKRRFRQFANLPDADALRGPSWPFKARRFAQAVVRRASHLGPVSARLRAILEVQRAGLDTIKTGLRNKCYQIQTNAPISDTFGWSHNLDRMT